MASPTSNSVPTTAIPLPANSLVTPLLHGTKWGGATGGGATLTYSFPSGTTYYSPAYSGADEWSGWTALGAQERAAVEAALAAWSAVADLRFVAAADAQDVVGELRFAKSPAVSDGFAAWAYLPGDYPAAGDVWLSPSYFTGTAPAGGYRFMVLMHEIGHGLGLKHPFEDNGVAGAVLDPSLDVHRATLMSYNAYPHDQTVSASIYPTTPMPYDIAAMQYLYGANTRWHTGADTYVYSGTGRYLETIWDAGGDDTIRYDSTVGGLVDLNPGAYSHLGRAVTFSNGASDPRTVAIAWGASIENAIGGSGNDTLIGTPGANRLSGRDGADVLRGGRGNDVLSGGGGADVMRGGHGDDRYAVDVAADRVVELADQGLDRVYSSISFRLNDNIETLILKGDAKIHGFGNALDNLVKGNPGRNALGGGGGDDVLSGFGGNDILVGGVGADRLTGGSGSDIFRFDRLSDGGDVITDFDVRNDTIAVRAAPFRLEAGPLDASLFESSANGTASDPEQRFLLRTQDASLWFDPDGNGRADPTLLCVLLGASGFDESSVLIV